MDYRMLRRGGRRRLVYDVSIEGVSLVATVPASRVKRAYADGVF